LKHSEKLAQVKARDGLDGFQCQCGFFTPDPEVAAAHIRSRGKATNYSTLHDQLAFVKDGTNLMTKDKVVPSSSLLKE